MKIIYGANDAIDAQRVIDRLAFEGIAANVLGGYLAGAAGELPMAGLVNVWVADEDEARAREVLASDEPESALPDESETDDTPAVVMPKGNGTGLLGFMGVLGLGALIGYVLAYGQLRLPHESELRDSDGNGVDDTTFDWRGESLGRRVTDRNEDGKPDEIVVSPDSPHATGSYDDNFDGRMETRLGYRHHQLHWLESDLDGDGHFEWRYDYSRGVLSAGTLTRPDGRTLKQLRYEGGVLAEESFDADGDGTLEVRRTFDARGERIPPPAG